MLFGATELLHKLALFLVELFRNLDIDSHNLWATFFRTNARSAMTSKLKVRARLRASWNFHCNLAINRLDVDFSAEYSIYHWDRRFGKNQFTFACKSLMCTYADLDIKIATLTALLRSWTTTTTQADALTVIDTSWNLKRNFLAINTNVLCDAKDRLVKVDCAGSLVIAATARGTETDCVSRSFCPKLSVAEDPVCGSAHCQIANYWSHELWKKEIKAYQASKRGGYLDCVLLDNGRIAISGEAVLVVVTEIVAELK